MLELDLAHAASFPALIFPLSMDNGLIMENSHLGGLNIRPEDIRA